MRNSTVPKKNCNRSTKNCRTVNAELQRKIEELSQSNSDMKNLLNGELRIVSASRSFYQTFAVRPLETEGHLLYEIGQRQWDIPALRQLLADILSQGAPLENFRVEHDFPTVGHKVLLLNARQVVPGGHPAGLILLAMEDITER